MFESIKEEFEQGNENIIKDQCFNDIQHLIKWTDKIRDSYIHEIDIKYGYYDDVTMDLIAHHMEFDSVEANEAWQKVTECIDYLDEAIKGFQKIVNV